MDNRNIYLRGVKYIETAWWKSPRKESILMKWKTNENKPFPDGLIRVPDSFEIFRILIVDPNKPKPLRQNNLGKHWVADPSAFFHRGFLSSIGAEFQLSRGMTTIWLVSGTVKFEDIDWDSTIKARIDFPFEREITTKPKVVPSNIFIQKNYSSLQRSLDYILKTNK